MQIKIKYPDGASAYDVQPIIINKKALSAEEDNEKLEAMNKLCNLIDLDEFSYYYCGREKLFSVRKTDEYLIIEINDDYIIQIQ